MKMTEKELNDPSNRTMSDERFTPNHKQYWEGAYRYEPYPWAWYRARLMPSGNVEVEIENARSAADEHSLTARDFRVTSTAAFALYETQQQYYAELAANKAHQDARLRSGRAQREAAAQDAATEGHVTDPREADRLAAVTPKPKRRGRPRKVAPETV